MCSLAKVEVVSDDFIDWVEEAYPTLQPSEGYLNQGRAMMASHPLQIDATIMVSKSDLLTFLQDLRLNNSKPWMDAHRERYQQVRARWIHEADRILQRLQPYDARLDLVSPKATISRINNNRRFHPTRPTYKDFMTCEPAIYEPDVSPIWVVVGATECFVGGGLWRPSKVALERFRSAVDYNGQEFRALLLEPSVCDFFVGLEHDPQRLKTAPQGYTKNHSQIDLLRYKNVTLRRSFDHELFLSDGFTDFVEEAYVCLQPVVAYLREAVAYDGG